MRLIAGDAFGLTSHVKTSSPLFYLHVVLQEGARFGLPTGHNERGAYIVKGSVEVNGITYTDGKLLVFTKGADPLIIAKENTTLMMPGGEYLGDLSGGTLYPAVRNGLSRLRKIGNRAVFSYLPQIMKNLFRCLKTIPSLREGLLPELFPDKSKFICHNTTMQDEPDDCERLCAAIQDALSVIEGKWKLVLLTTLLSRTISELVR